MQLKNYINKFLIIFYTLNITNAYAIYEDYCKNNKLGWHFYCDKKQEKKIKENKQIKETTTKNYTEKLEDLQKQLEESKAKAVLEPTEQNIKEYVILQMAMLNQASLFSDSWRRTLWKTPEFDYLQQRPVNSQSKTIFDGNRQKLEEENLKNINKEYGIFFVYSTTCPYCIKYGEILYNIKQEFNINIVGISLDRQFLTNWENNSKIYNKELEKLNIPIKSIPITLLYNNTKKQITVVGYGLLTRDELLSRVYLLTNKKVGEDY